ncbi:MAG: hypothetical protein KDI27_09680 [Gammaproteobacteria bacterium]|nr:hypothetical protein [Gammaproteobacteria bacterium]MCP5416341.1 hypothetical protein [Chromatiaceae bacterium]
MRLQRILPLLLALLLLAGCASVPQHKVHYRLIEAQSGRLTTGKAILLPLKIKVKEMTASGITEVVPTWTEVGNNNFSASLQRNQQTLFGNMTWVNPPALDEAEATLLDQHIALNETVVSNAVAVTNALSGNAWTHKRKHFDYSIGPGLAFLADRTGADKAILVMGEDVRSSGGRKAAFVVLAAFGVGIPLGHAVTFANIIDLRSGDILWMNQHVSVGELGYLDGKHTDRIVQDLFKEYPGIDSYRQWLANSK